MSAIIEIPSQSQPAIALGSINGQPVKLRQITVEKYDLMIANGFFDEDDQIELLDGVIIDKMPKGTKHSAATDRAARVFYHNFAEKVLVRNQNSIWLDKFSEPEPDIVLAFPKEDEYESSHPTPEEIYLVLEVSDSTLDYDRNAKGAAYARAGIQQYLLLNIQERTLEDYREPNISGEFQSKQTYRAGQNFNLLAFPEVYLKVSDFLLPERN